MNLYYVHRINDRNRKELVCVEQARKEAERILQILKRKTPYNYTITTAKM